MKKRCAVCRWWDRETPSIPDPHPRLGECLLFADVDHAILTSRQAALVRARPADRLARASGDGMAVESAWFTTHESFSCASFTARPGTQ